MPIDETAEKILLIPSGVYDSFHIAVMRGQIEQWRIDEIDLRTIVREWKVVHEMMESALHIELPDDERVGKLFGGWCAENAYGYIEPNGKREFSSPLEAYKALKEQADENRGCSSN